MDIKMGKAKRTEGKQTKRPSLPIWMLIKSKLSVRVVVLLRLPVTSSLFTCRVNLVLLATACNHPNNYSFWLCFHYWRYEGLQLVTTWPPLSPETVEARVEGIGHKLRYWNGQTTGWKMSLFLSVNSHLKRETALKVYKSESQFCKQRRRCVPLRTALNTKWHEDQVHQTNCCQSRGEQEREQQNHPKIDTKETKHSNIGAALLKLCREKKLNVRKRRCKLFERTHKQPCATNN